jgi:hypothetical protein
MASAERVKRLPGVVFGNDLALEVDAVAAVSGHGHSSSESPPPVNRKPLNLSNSRGALHAGVTLGWLLQHLRLLVNAAPQVLAHCATFRLS